MIIKKKKNSHKNILRSSVQEPKNMPDIARNMRTDLADPTKEVKSKKKRYLNAPQPTYLEEGVFLNIVGIIIPMHLSCPQSDPVEKRLFLSYFFCGL